MLQLSRKLSHMVFVYVKISGYRFNLKNYPF